MKFHSFDPVSVATGNRSSAIHKYKTWKEAVSDTACITFSSDWLCSKVSTSVGDAPSIQNTHTMAPSRLSDYLLIRHLVHSGYVCFTN